MSGLSDVLNYPANIGLDNVAFKLYRLSIADAGSGYQDPPKIIISGGGGTGATAEAFIGNKESYKCNSYKYR